MKLKSARGSLHPRRPHVRGAAAARAGAPRPAGASAHARAVPGPQGRRGGPARKADARNLAEVRALAEHCRDCPLWKNATQTVFGAGLASARIVLVGEQPGDREDLEGLPFVGPAGRLLDRALEQAGIDREMAYVTNAVMHFKFEPRGKRRIHKKPNEMEITACHQWLERELRLIRPRLIVALGATAARAIFGRPTAIESNRGRVIAARGMEAAQADILVTVHPSYLLRVPHADKAAAYERFVQDLSLARDYA